MENRSETVKDSQRNTKKFVIVEETTSKSNLCGGTLKYNDWQRKGNQALVVNH